MSSLKNLNTHALARRGFMQKTTAISGLILTGSLGIARIATAANITDKDFLTISEFVTGHQLDGLTSGRFFAALQKNDAQFADNLVKLNEAITASKASNMDAFLATNPSQDLIATATAIVSAWYLGVVGQGDKAVLITFYDALMFDATRKYVYVPTYGGGPNSWVKETHAKA